MPLTVGALFAGYGGLDLGLDMVLDTRLSWVSEIEPAPAAILRHHWPDAPNLGDVTTVDWSAVPRVDVVTGGSPCQDLSNAGARRGMRPGTRSGLWAAMARAIETIHPRIVVWENVRGALSAKAASDMEPCPGCLGGPGEHESAMRALGRVLADLAILGYDAAWYGLPAAGVGACHPRFRVFVVAVQDAADAGRIRREYGQGAPGREPHALRAGAPALTLLPTPAVNDMGEGKTLEWWDEWAPRQKSAAGAPAPHGKSLAIEAQRLLPTPTTDDAGNLSRDSGDFQSLTRTVRAQSWGDYADAVRRAEVATGRPAPSPTEDGRLSARFVEWMMMLPEGHVTDVPGVSRNQALKALGNGVVPAQAAAGISAALDALAGAP